MFKVRSTKIAHPIPVEFERNYIEHGVEVCERMYGKRATTRCRFAIGASKLKRARRQFLDGLGAVTSPGLSAQG